MHEVSASYPFRHRCNLFESHGIQSDEQSTQRGEEMPVEIKQDRFEGYEVYDEQGNSVGRVILPRQARPFGPTRGTVFLSRQPEGLRAPSASRVA